MDLTSENNKVICRLCLQTSDDVVNIWDTFQGSTIALILVKHFWFEIHKNDGLTESLCQVCWIQTKAFHEFYKNIEKFQKILLDSIDSVEKVVSDVTIDTVAASESNLNMVKCEEAELMLEAIQSQIDMHDSSDDDNISEECESEKSLNDEEEEDVEDQCSNNEQNDNSDRALRPKTLSKSYLCTSKKLELEALIREFFNMKCEICSDVEFETLLKAQRHYRKVHGTKGNFVCCGKKFDRRQGIIRHVRYHTNAFRCDQCNKNFASKESLNNHIGNHVPIDSREFKCTLCRSSFAQAIKLKQHVKLTHTAKTGEKFPCDKCGKNFRSNLLLSCHIRQIHELTQKYVCEVCARLFKTKQTLQYHIKFEHSTAPPPKVQCNICGVWLKHQAGLNKHLARHKENEPVNCSICNKEVRNKDALRYHISYVHREQSYSCTLCNKTFKRAKNLKEHLAIHTGEDLYDCPYCEKKFKSSGNMYNHRKNAHLEEWNLDFPQRKASTKVSAKQDIGSKSKT